MILLATVWSVALSGGATAETRAACRRGPADAGARALARTEQTTAETFATDHDGFYTGLSRLALRRYEPSIPITPSQAQHEDDRAYASAARAIEHGGGYIVRARTLSGHVYSVLKDRFGHIHTTADTCGRIESW